jgi:hypothetical protein
VFSKLPITEFFEFSDKNSFRYPTPPFIFQVLGVRRRDNKSEEGGDRSKKLGGRKKEVRRNRS